MIIENDDSGDLFVASADATADYFLLINPLATVFSKYGLMRKTVVNRVGGWVK